MRTKPEAIARDVVVDRPISAHVVNIATVRRRGPPPSITPIVLANSIGITIVIIKPAIHLCVSWNEYFISNISTVTSLQYSNAVADKLALCQLTHLPASIEPLYVLLLPN